MKPQLVALIGLASFLLGCAFVLGLWWWSDRRLINRYKKQIPFFNPKQLRAK